MADTGPEPRPKKTPGGAFDIRVVIALLVGIYGVVLVVLGVIADPAEVAKSDGININLWGGIAMLVFAAAFVLWARIRPILVPVDEPPDD
jgi:hypothetical protein